ncbi:ABC transporter permease [Martelella sp. HB161492]|uniref:ABC transporter permease n=1 Tax=Martelella sp. HB161492 TaxID=2720726 RepID=UPI0015910EA0|nr:ABC transporter permease [Martelella sp. HB161492]
MLDLVATIFSATFLVMVIRTATPLLFATMGGLIADLSGALNVALEGMMLIAALTAVVTSVYAPWYVAVIAAMAAGGLFGAVMGYFHLNRKADVVLVGFAINIFATGGTVFALSLATGGDKGTSINLISKAVPELPIPGLAAVPVVGPTLDALFGHNSVLSWLALLSVIGVWYVLYRTPYGLWLRGVGEYPAAAEAAGISVMAVKFWALVASGALAGIGGAQLAMFNYVGFTRDMTAGRGFIALGAVLLGARHPVGAALAALFFGFFEALSIVMPNFFAWIPAEIIQAIPFAVTIIALVLFSYRASRGRRMKTLAEA